MRHKLKELDGQRIQVIAQVVRFGNKSAFRGLPLKTICLSNVEAIDGAGLCDHLWLTVGKQIEKLNLSVGDNIKFDARVKRYEKGYRGNEIEAYSPIESDYKLSNPTKFNKIT